METVPLRTIKSPMNRASDETRRLVEENDRPTSSSLEDEDVDEEEYIKGDFTARESRTRLTDQHLR
jgi:hypothetical protein